MVRHLKIQTSFRFGELLGNTAERRFYMNSLSFTYSTPYVFYLWLIHKNGVIFYKRPRNVTSQSFVYKVGVYFPTRKDAYKFACKVTKKILHRMFNQNTRYIML